MMFTAGEDEHLFEQVNEQVNERAQHDKPLLTKPLGVPLLRCVACLPYAHTCIRSLIDDATSVFPEEQQTMLIFENASSNIWIYLVEEEERQVD